MRQLKSMRIALVVLSLTAFADSEAFQFVPADTEWAAWPSYCKAKYVWTNIGKESKWTTVVTEMDRAELAKWEDTGIYGLHHYCAGMIYLNRARLGEDEQRRLYDLRQALSETEFSFTKSNQQSPYFAQLAIQMVSILYEQENFQDAKQILTGAIATQPDNAVLYSALAVMQRRLGKLEQAKETLLRGNEALKGNSAEINYNLGLISIELGEIDEAVKYAQTAYGLGFPLPGLRNKLEELGRM